MIDKQIDAFSGDIFSFIIVTGKSREWGGGRQMLGRDERRSWWVLRGLNQRGAREGADLGLGGVSQEDEAAHQSLTGAVEEGTVKLSLLNRLLSGPCCSIAAPPGSDGILPAWLLPDCLNLCSLVLQPLRFTAAFSRSGGVKTRDYTVSGLPF